jgi:hypothetical protein
MALTVYVRKSRTLNFRPWLKPPALQSKPPDLSVDQILNSDPPPPAEKIMIVGKIKFG